ncbi:MAG: hypothetical protein DRI70_03010 [Bacteroidetes bacterium]|nr:MAG: hypothetical protein DRI70_03010 [Bacteroidota bacterium]
MKEENAYILGTDAEELHRLGVQHQVWAEEAQHGWCQAEFHAGQTLLDLGSGPGFCARELAYIAGKEGKVIAVDMSEAYMEHLKQITSLYQLNIEPVHANFDELVLQGSSIDGMYCRWALAWLTNPKEILKNVYKALKPGGKMVIHEYYDWSTHQTEPKIPALAIGIAAALKSFKESPGEIDIGRELPKILEDMGMKVIGLRLMPKLATVNSLIWQWPKTFYKSYFPRLEQLGYLSNEEVSEALNDLITLENTIGATFFGPMMIEVIAEK